jgi:hypothetical protein
MFPGAQKKRNKYVHLKGGLRVSAWDIDTEDKDEK